MRILLVGEYSRLHNSLKEGLVLHGHRVTLIATGDYFKGYPADILLKRKFESGVLKKIKVLLYRIFKIDITSENLKKQFFNQSEKLKGFDVVQLINESPFGALPKDEIKIIRFLHKHNGKLFLLCCGTDYNSVTYLLNNKTRYDILWGYKNKSIPEKKYEFATKYVKPSFKVLHKKIQPLLRGIIASDLDYHIPLQGNSKYLGLIPNPVNVDKIKELPLQRDTKISIFLGINKNNYHTKGISYFEEALAIITKKYGECVSVTISENIPYQQYINLYDQAHILLDQVLGWDQGYNALEAMAKGKVVFTGAESEFLEQYQVKEDEVCINALPDVPYLVSKLEDLIIHPEKILKIGENARSFIVKHHHYRQVAETYLKTWEEN
ncbi:MAG: glycosyltransferase [Flavobacteriaceae bacterium]